MLLIINRDTYALFLGFGIFRQEQSFLSSLLATASREDEYPELIRALTRRPRTYRRLTLDKDR